MLAAGEPTQAASGPMELLDAAPECQEDEPAMFKTDSFRMNCMKVLQCSKRYVHDWTECPFAHPQEKARRRDPRVYTYTGIACPSMKKEGTCAFGDHCPYAHNVFEYWLHPTRYRTQLCNDGSNCRRKICFFAHSLEELRVPACKPFVSPEALAAAAAAAAADAEAKRKAGTVGAPALGPALGLQGSGALEAIAAQAQQLGAEGGSMEPLRSSGSSGGEPAPPSPIATRAGSGAGAGASPVDVLTATLQQLQGRGFSQQEQQVIELVTNMLSQDRISAAQAASILQAMLPAGALHLLQSHLLAPATPGTSDLPLQAARSMSDPLADAARARASLDGAGAGGARMSLPSGPAASANVFATMMALQGGAGQYCAMAPYPGASPRVSVDYARGASFDASSMRSSFDQAGFRDSMDFGSARGSVDYSRQPSVELGGYGPAGVQLAQASSLYQPQQPVPVRSSGNSSSMQPLPPVPEHAPSSLQPLPPVSAALAQLAARTAEEAAPAPQRQSTPAQALAAAEAAVAASAEQQQQQLRRRQSTSDVGAAAAGPVQLAAGYGQQVPLLRRHSVDSAMHAALQRQQLLELHRSRQSMDGPYQALPQVREGVALLAAAAPAYVQQYPQQYMAQYEDRTASLDATADMLRMSSELSRMSMESDYARRASVERRPAPMVANPFSSSLFAPAAAAPVAGAVGGPRLAAPVPARAVSALTDDAPGPVKAARCASDPASAVPGGAP